MHSSAVEFNRNILYCKLKKSRFFSTTKLYLIETFCIVNNKNGGGQTINYKI